MRNKRACQALASAIALSSAIGGLTAVQAAPDGTVLWFDAAHANAAFISGPALEAVANRPTDEIMRSTALSARDAAVAKADLEIDLKVTKENLGRGETCIRHHDGMGFGPIPAANSLTFADLIQREAVAVVGTVEQATAGLTLPTTEISTYAFLRVSEVLHDTSNSIKPGQAVSFLQLGGTISYKGVPICTDSGGRHVPAVGEHLLLIGARDYGETIAGKLLPTWLFVIEDERVIPNSFYRSLAEATAKPLAQIRAELAGKAAGHE
jgi:hypothetical protein